MMKKGLKIVLVLLLALALCLADILSGCIYPGGGSSQGSVPTPAQSPALLEPNAPPVPEDGASTPDLTEAAYLTENRLELSPEFAKYDGILAVGPRPGVFALRNDGALWSGAYDLAPLGRDDTEEEWGPVAELDAKALEIGQWAGLALEKDGTLWGWGGELYGQAGTAEPASVPAQVLTGVRQVELGVYYAAAVREDDSLWLWGQYAYPLKPADIELPVQVMTDVLCISDARNTMLLILKRDGTLWTLETRDDNGEVSCAPVWLSGGMIGISGPVALAEGGTAWDFSNHPQCGKAAKLPLTPAAVGRCGDGLLLRDSAGTLWRWDGAEAHRVGSDYAFIVDTDRYPIYIDNAGDLCCQYDGGDAPVRLAGDVACAKCCDICLVYLKTDGTLWMTRPDASGAYDNAIQILDDIAMP